MAWSRALVPFAIAGLVLALAESCCRLAAPDWRLARASDPPWLSFLHPELYYPVEPRPDVELISFIGGSTTAGYPFPEAGFPEWAERELAACGRKNVWAANRGSGGYGTIRGSAALGPILAERPRWVVIEGGHNEIQELMLYRLIPPLLRGPVGRWLSSSALVVGLARARAGRLADGPLKAAWGIPADLPEPSPDEVERAFETRLRAMARAAKAAGARPMFCLAPVNRHFPPTESAPAAAFAALADARRLRAAGKPLEARARLAGAPKSRAVTWLLALCAEDLRDWKEAARLLREAADPYVSSQALRAAQRRVAAEEGAPLVDLEAAFSKGEPEGLPARRYFVDSHHLSALGYRAAAREIVAALAAAEPGPEPCPAPWDGRADGMLERDLGFDPSYEAVPLALMANEYSLYAETSGDEWFRREAVSNLVAALSIDRAATLKRLRLESPTVARSLSLAEAELARKPR